MVPRLSMVAVGPLILALVAGEAAAKKNKRCAADTDCKKARVCVSAQCRRLSPEVSLLRVRLEGQVHDATLYIDDVPMGGLPFEGVVSAGEHRIGIEAPGYLPARFVGVSTGGQVDQIPVRLEPAPAQPPSPQPQEQMSSPSPQTAPGEDGPLPDLPRRIYLAGIVGGGYGNAVWEGGKASKTTTILGGLAVGARLLDAPVWIDLGLSVVQTTLYIPRWSSWGEFMKLHVGLQPRLLFPLKQRFIYLGVELEGGIGVSSLTYSHGEGRIALSIFPTDDIEIRLNPMGVELVYEINLHGYILSYNATAAVAIRFGDF